MKLPKWLPVFGDVAFRGQCPSETGELITFFFQLQEHYPRLAEIAIHPRNEGKRHNYQYNIEVAEGMNPGASDIIIPGAPSFVCELKRQDHTKSRWQNNQEYYLSNCQNRGAFVCVALGHAAALEAVKEWYEGS